MNRISLLSRLLLVSTGFLAGFSASAQISVIYGLNFNNPGNPWASTGNVAITGGTVGTPTLQNTDLAPGAGNAYSAVFDGSQYQYGSNFAGLNPGTTGYGIQLWVKDSGSTFPPVFYSSIASFGQPNDDGFETGHNGISIGLYDNAYWGVSNSSFVGIRSNVMPLGSGAINGWEHLALVVDGSTLGFYRNGALLGTHTGSIDAPGDSWYLFASAFGLPQFTGMADDLKLFTFPTGTFNAAQLDYAAVSAIPEPSTYAAICAAGALGFALWRRRHLRTTGNRA